MNQNIHYVQDTGKGFQFRYFICFSITMNKHKQIDTVIYLC